jgi:hypothetical protein
MNIDAETHALLQRLNVTLKPGDAPLAIIALARHIGDLQRRLDALEAVPEQPRKRGLLRGLKAGISG